MGFYSDRRCEQLDRADGCPSMSDHNRELGRIPIRRKPEPPKDETQPPSGEGA